MSRIGNTLRNSRWGLLQRLVSMALPFIVRSLLIHTLSAAYAGLGSLFVSVFSVLNLTELGFSSAVAYSMYRPVAKGDTDRICALLAVFRKTYRMIGCVVGILGLIMLPLLPVFVKSDLPDTVNLYLLFCVYLADLLIGYFLYGYQSCLLSVHQREDIISRNAVISGILLRCLQCAVLIVFRNYYLFVLLIPAATVLQNLLNHVSARRLFPDCVPRGKIDPDTAAGLKKHITGLAIWKVGAASRNTFDSIVLSMYLGLVPVAIYNNYMMILLGVSSVLGIFSSSMLAGVGNKIALSSPEENYRDFRKFHFLYMWLAGWCTVCMLCLYQPFMAQWAGKDMLVPDWVMVLFCFLFFMLKQGDINSVYYQAAGLWWQGKLRSIIEAGCNLVLNLVLGKAFGMPGILGATILSYAVAYFYGSRFTFTCYFKNNGLRVFYLDNLKYLLVTAGCGIVTLWLSRLLSGLVSVSIWASVVCLGICILVPNVLFFLIYVSDPVCREWLRYARNNILKRRVRRYE